MAGVPGQGRKFDIDSALTAAMNMFWRQGYEGTTVAGLTKTMGISPPSLYAAFGDKRQLFDRVVEHYLSGPGAWMDRVFEEETTVPGLVGRLLVEAAHHYADPDEPGGCLVVNAGSTVMDSAVASVLRDQRNANVARLQDRLRSGDELGELPNDVDPRAAAEFLAATIQGMSTRARDGATVGELVAAAALAARALDIDIRGQTTAPTYR
ncbi:TetR/AcrR family transcriptional regulator [Rhodococcus sp. BE178]|uniref:TetR/AcrR family transcriptional regulator n=1 Tax=Rhodococcus sp. BE178 TaxID=2817737 RepID=UPI003D19C7AC